MCHLHTRLNHQTNDVAANEFARALRALIPLHLDAPVMIHRNDGARVPIDNAIVPRRGTR